MFKEFLGIFLIYRDLFKSYFKYLTTFGTFACFKILTIFRSYNQTYDLKLFIKIHALTFKNREKNEKMQRKFKVLHIHLIIQWSLYRQKLAVRFPIQTLETSDEKYNI